MNRICITFIVIALCNLVNAQSSIVKLFLDPQFDIDKNRIMQQIDFVEYILDRQNADIYMQLVEQDASNDGSMISIYTKNMHTADVDTIQLFTNPNITELDLSNTLISNIKKGILPYLIDTGMDIQYDVVSQESENTREEVDRWRSWIFNVGMIGFLEGEQAFSSREFGAKFNVIKVIDDWKFSSYNKYYVEESTFNFNDTTQFVNVNKSLYTSNFFAKSINQHWSIGLSARLSNSTFSNYKLASRLSPSIEYSVYPYDEATTKTLKCMYRIGPEYNRYIERTILDKSEEINVKHTFNAVYAILKEWGEVSVNLYADQYVNQPTLYSLTLGPKANWNIAKGLRFECGANISYIGDRINVPQAEISNEELILQSKIVDTSFSYFSFIGLNYRFGSSSNNVVNTRFDDYDFNLSVHF